MSLLQKVINLGLKSNKWLIMTNPSLKAGVSHIAVSVGFSPSNGFGNTFQSGQVMIYSAIIKHHDYPSDVNKYILNR